MTAMTDQQAVYLNDEQRQEEYLSAQRAAIEALHMGRATLDQSCQQQEQLERADAMADETQYKLDKAAKILRGMTWSGWVANMFSKSNGPPPENTLDAVKLKKRQPPQTYENMPQECETTAQAIQNYHANVNVLEACETNEQRDTVRNICDAMYMTAVERVQHLHENNTKVEAYALQFVADLATLRERQVASQERLRDIREVGLNADASKQELMPNNKPTSPFQKPYNDIAQKQQDDHLDMISQSLGELGSIAKSLHQSISVTNEAVDRLDSKSENILEKSKLVTRRADRIIQKKSWTPIKPTYHADVAIRHVRTGKWLAVASNGSLHLLIKLHPETCIFALWKRQGEIFGLRNRFNDKWVGQSMFGNLACSAGSFGRREEWEADNNTNWKDTHLMCTSAGWGAGGYLLVRDSDSAVSIGGYGVDEKKKAATWCIMDQSEITE